MEPDEERTIAPPRPVFLLHGLGRSSASMWLLARRLRRAGFPAHALDYPSTRQSLPENTDFVRDLITRRECEYGCDLVGHSMGGVIARRLCRECADLNIGRVVQIGAPNLGSFLADRLGPFWAVQKACGPSVADLRAISGPVEIDPRLAAIAGTGGCSRGNGLLRGPHDGAVTVRSAWAGAAHRYRVAAMHTLMPTSTEVSRHVIDALVTDAEFYQA